MENMDTGTIINSLREMATCYSEDAPVVELLHDAADRLELFAMELRRLASAVN